MNARLLNIANEIRSREIITIPSHVTNVTENDENDEIDGNDFTFIHKELINSYLTEELFMIQIRNYLSWVYFNLESDNDKTFLLVFVIFQN